MEMIVIGAVAAVAIVVLWLAGRSRMTELKSRLGESEQAAESWRTEAESCRGYLVDSQRNEALLGERLATQQSYNLQLKAEIAAERDRLTASFNQEREQMTREFSIRFENLANEILERKSRSMTDQSRESITAMLKPLGENLENFRRRIEEESKLRFALEAQVKHLAELNMRMSQEANNLTAALRGNSKSQGDWGEMILETLLENSGLKRDLHFRVQESIRDEHGNLHRPDIILSLPDEKEVVIDSKVSLTAYISYTEAEDEPTRKTTLAAHSLSVRNHIIELGAKSYSKLVRSPDFVILFIPNEPAFLLALQSDSTLWQEAYKRGVILSSPTNLFAILRIVDDLWRRDSQSRNALEIARQGGDLYDKFVLFAETFADVGSSIRKSEELYDKAFGQLSSGRGNLVARIEKLRSLGLKTTKQLPRKFTEQGSVEEIP